MSILDVLPHKCTIRRRVRAGDSGDEKIGGSRNKPVDEQTGVECWEQAMSDGSTTEFEKRGETDDVKIYFKTDPGVTTRHQILITERLGVSVSSPVVLDVQSSAVPDATAGMAILFRVKCNLLKSEKQ